MADYVLSAKITGNAADYEKAISVAQTATDNFNKNISSAFAKSSQQAGKSLSEIAAESGKTVNELRSDVMKAAAEYEKAGMTKSEAMKKAYADIGYSAEEANRKSKKSINDTSRTLDDLGNKAVSVADKLGNIGNKFSNIGSSLTSKITKPAIAATGALAAIPLVKGFDRLVGIDTARSKLQALGHDAQSVEKIMDSALTSVQGTAFGLDEAATVAANAVAAGIKPGQELTKYLTMTADAAAIAGISMSEMGSILNKVQTGQTVYTEDLEQLADRGLPVYQWIAEEAGVAASEVKKLASEGQISSEMLFNAINKNIGGAAKIMGETSFTAAVDNIGASLGRIGANFLDAGGKGGGFFSQLKPLMAEFNEQLGAVEQKASELGVKFGEAFADMVSDVKEFIANFRALPDWLQSAIIKVTSFGAIFLVALGPALKIIGSITTAYGRMVKTIGAIKSAAGAVKGFAGDIKTVQAAFNGMMGPLTQQQQKMYAFATSAKTSFQSIRTSAQALPGYISASFQGLGTTFSSVGATIATTAKSARTSLISMGTAAKAAIAPFLPAIAVFAALAAAIVYLWNTNDEFKNSMIASWNEIKAAFEPVLQSMATLITQVVQAIMPAIQELANAFSQLIPAITPIITLAAKLVAGLMPLVTMLVSSLAPVITQIAASLAPVISQLVGALAPILTTIGNIITTYIMPAITTIVSIVANVINTIIQIVTPIVTFIAGVVGNIISVIASIINTVASVFNKIYSTVTSVMGRVKSAIVGVFNAIKSAWSGLTGFVSGIFNGIAGAVQSLVNRVKSIVNSVIRGINAAISLINKIPGVSIGKIPQLAHGTDNWQGGFAAMNEGGRGELTYLPNGSQVIPHDISVKYAKESARANAAAEPLDVYALGAYIVDAVTTQGAQIAGGLERGVSKIKMVPDDRNMARYIGKLGFERS